MLKVYLNELRKVKRQKTVRMIMLVGVLMPTFSFALCLHNGYRLPCNSALFTSVRHYLCVHV